MSLATTANESATPSPAETGLWLAIAINENKWSHDAMRLAFALAEAHPDVERDEDAWEALLDRLEAALAGGRSETRLKVAEDA
jgi:hypothetical protein